MAARRPARRRMLFLPLLVLLIVVSWQVTVVLAQAPAPHPLPKDNPFYEANITNVTQNGPAVNVHGNPAAGRTVFAQSCASCHGPRGTDGVPNPGSDDGAVPALNPIDPGFLEQDSGDPTSFIKGIDLFIQHGSRPEGDKPTLSMTGWGDRKLITQQQVADVEAYVMQLNGVYWADRWNPPIDIQVTTKQQGITLTYSILLVNEGSANLTNLTLRDTLPTGLTYVDSYMPGPGQNRGGWSGSTVQWDIGSGVPQGGTLGPFVIIVRAADAKKIPANVAQAVFDWTDFKGDVSPATAVSAPALPVPPATPTPRPAPTKPAATALPVATAAPTVVVTATSTTTTTTGSTTTETATSVPPTPEPTQVPAPTAAPTTVDTTAGQTLFQQKNCSACHIINGTGGAVGPNLTHIGSQPFDSLPNTPDFLTKWLTDPKAQKSDTIMPKPDLTPDQITALVNYLVSLK
jgi:uncharacterized repeat protein (TIGR01451 family)